MKKALKVITAAALAATVVTADAQAYLWGDYSDGRKVEEHTQLEITEKYISLNLNEDWNIEYDKEPSITTPYSPGSLSQKTLQQALDMTNFVRYIAGLPEVELDDDYNYLAQCASLVNAANDRMSHYPDKPDGIDDELYEAGRIGASTSNLGCGYKSIPKSIKEYMNDHTESSVGHRRWILYPGLGKVGFGYAGDQTAMHVIDFDFNTNYSVDYVTWPPKNMPMELYRSYGGMISLFEINSYPFSVSFDSSYDISSLYDAVVHVKCETDGREWTISQDQQSDETSFHVSTEGYGAPACIIFRMVGGFDSGDKVNINITGLTKNGMPADIDYEVNFFTMLTDIDDCTVSPLKTLTYTGKALKPEPVIKYNGKELVPDIDYTLEYENNKKPGKAKIVINGKGKYTGSIETYFFIKPKKQKIRSITSSNSNFTVKWTKQPEDVGYEVQYSTKSSMKGAESRSFSGIIYDQSIWAEKGKKYYVRVRSFIYSNGYYGEKIYGAWSKIKTVYVK